MSRSNENSLGLVYLLHIPTSHLSWLLLWSKAMYDLVLQDSSVIIQKPAHKVKCFHHRFFCYPQELNCNFAFLSSTSHSRDTGDADPDPTPQISSLNTSDRTDTLTVGRVGFTLLWTLLCLFKGFVRWFVSDKYLRFCQVTKPTEHDNIYSCTNTLHVTIAEENVILKTSLMAWKVKPIGKWLQ